MDQGHQEGKRCPVCRVELDYIPSYNDFFCDNCKRCLGQMLPITYTRKKEKGGFEPCPRCGYDSPSKVRFTLWGGLVGPRLLHHVKCPGCGMKYNGKTGQSNTRAIVLYLTLPPLVAILLLLLAFSV